ncbi:MAG: SLC13 family permease [Deltaproteobacteria bacterium]|nr:SLC13 family permease [Deltaproteobacteria bacterium]
MSRSANALKPAAEKIETGLIIKWTLSIALPLLLWLLPLGIPRGMQIYLAISLWAVVTWMFELVDNAISGTLLPVFFILSGVAGVQEAFKGWTSAVPWVTLGGMIFGAVMVSTGLAKRLTFKILTYTGTSFLGIVIGILIISAVITPFMPSVTGKTALMLPLIIGVCQVMGIQPKSKEASAIMLALFSALWSAKMAYLTGSADSVLLASLVFEYTGLSIDWGTWSYQMAFPSLVWTVVATLLVLTMKPQNILIPKEKLQEQYAELGPMPAKQVKAAVMLVALAVALCSDRWHHVNPAWTLMVMSGTIFVPGINLITKDDLYRLVNWPVVFFLAGSMSIGNVAGAPAVNFVKALVGWVLPLLQGMSDVLLCLTVWCLGFLGCFVLNQFGLSSAFTGPIAQIFGQLGLNPFLGAYSLIFGFDSLFFPYQCAPILLIYACGYLNLTDLFKQMAIRTVAALVVFLVIVIPYWQLVGLFARQ